MKTAVFLFLVLLNVQNNIQAAVISRDWKTPGDGLLTYDTVNKREWLDVSESLLYHYGNFDLVVAETAFGGDFEGFAAAKTADIVALAESAGIDTGTQEFETNKLATVNLVNFLSATTESGSSTFGLIDQFSGNLMSLPNQLVAAISVSNGSNFAGLSFVHYGDLGDRPHQIVGVMLYRVVPEPFSYSFAVAGILLCVLRRW